MSLFATPLQDMRCQVLSNLERGNGLKLLRLQVVSCENGLSPAFACHPGQFIMLDLPDQRFYFRRPFSVIDTPTADTFDVYYKKVGTGTDMMWQLEPGEFVQCLGPLGNGFAPPTEPETALYIGGGIGIAPPYLMGKHQAIAGHCLYGVRSATEVGIEAELKAVFGEQLHIATDDGSYGFHGNVCQLLQAKPELARSAKEAYVCGPTRMMQAVAELLQELNPQIRVQVSLEERMPCGTGACTGCVVPRRDQYLPSKVCVEGPVFEASSILWHGDFLPASHFCEERACTL